MSGRIEDEHIDEIRELRAKGLTYVDIGEQLGVSPATARRYTVGKRKGYKTESNGHAGATGNGTATAGEAPRPLVPTAFACPWCQNPVIAPLLAE